MKFSLKTFLTLVAFTALILALLISRSRTKAINLEAADLAADLYRKHLLRELEKPYGSLFPPGWTAIATSQGDIVDLTTPNGRTELLSRIESGKTDFRVRCSDGQIMQQSDLLIAPYEIYWWRTEQSSHLLTSNSLIAPSDNQGMHRSSGGSSTLKE